MTKKKIVKKKVTKKKKSTPRRCSDCERINKTVEACVLRINDLQRRNDQLVKDLEEAYELRSRLEEARKQSPCNAFQLLSGLNQRHQESYANLTLRMEQLFVRITDIADELHPDSRTLRYMTSKRYRILRWFRLVPKLERD